MDKETKKVIARVILTLEIMAGLGLFVSKGGPIVLLALVLALAFTWSLWQLLDE